MQQVQVIEFDNEFGLKDKWYLKGSQVLKTEFTYPKTQIESKTKFKLNKMQKSQELFEQINDLYQQFTEGHQGRTKKAKKEARKAIGELKKLVTDYRKASVEEEKQ